MEWPKGIKKTKQRECVLSILENADSPMSAADIYIELEKVAGSDVRALSTVYRVLGTFVEGGIVNKITVMDNETAVYELNRHNHKHYAICVGCHKMVELNECPFKDYEPTLDNEDFKVVGHKVEIYGYCADCDKKIPDDDKEQHTHDH